MDQIMGVLQPIIDTVSGIFGGDFDPATIIDTIKGFIESIVGGIA